MIRNLLFLFFLCIAFAAQAQYLETFSTPNKGYFLNCVNDVTGVNWSLTPWDPTGTCQNNPSPGITDIRDPQDYFQTTAAGKMESIDTDQEVCWESPLMSISAAGTVSLSVDLTWNGIDSDVAANNCSTDYIKVLYSVNGGAYTMVPNQFGGNACATIAYPFGGPPSTSSMGTVTQGGISGTTLKIRVCIATSANAELVTIDNVSVPQAGVTVGCAAPALSTVVTQVGCSNPNSGAINLSVSAGTPGYTYDWSNDGPETPDNDPQDLSGLPVGTYTVTVTDAASCSATISAAVTLAPALSLSTQVLNTSCSGTAEGEIDLIFSGGVPGYTYDWSNDGPETPDNDTQDLIGVGTGTYTVTLTDASGCTATTSATVGVLPSGAYNEQFNTPNKGYLANFVDDFSAVNWSMSGWTSEPPATLGRDAADFFRTGGGVLVGEDFDQEICWQSPLIDLNGGTQFSVNLAWTGFDVQVDEYINVQYSIDGGSYVTLPNLFGGGAGTIQYAAGLDQNGSLLVTKTGLSGGTIQIQICGNFNANSESMTIDNVSVPGSGGPFCPGPEASVVPTNVSCNGAANGSINLSVVNGSTPYTYAWSNLATSQDIGGLAPGTYTVTVTDNNMLTATASAIISQPTAIVLNFTQVNLLCNGATTGSIDLSVSGGVSGYTYDWSNDGPETPDNDPQDLSGLAAGNYTITVTDATGCTKTTSVTITAPTAIALSTTQVNVLCNGGATGSIDLSVIGGISPYTYNWGAGQPTTQDRSGLSAGTYCVTVTDFNGCTKTTCATITELPAIVLSATQVNVSCIGGSNGSIDLTVSGGTPGYTYNWGAGQPTTQDRSDLIAGIYCVTVTDANGCTKTACVTITEPTEIVLSTTQVNVSCNSGSNGSIDLTVSGGTTGYTYNWGAGQPTTQDRTGLGVGTYCVTVTDANGCTKTTCATITEPPVLVLSTTQVNATCNGGSNGSIDLTVSGGMPGYTYNWGAGQPTTQDRSSLSVGTYCVTVTDANGCTQTTCATITESSAILLSTTQVNVTCNGASTGSIDLSVSNGTPGYTYNWGAGQPTTQDRTDLTAGTYCVTVTDANGCTKTTCTTITELPAIVLSTTQVNVSCIGGSNGSIDLTVSGGTPGYTYNWGAGQPTTQDRSGLLPAVYCVTVTDANGCTKTACVTITEPTEIALTTSQVNVSCNGGSNGSIDLTVTGGTPGYTYNWGAGQPTTQDRSGLTAGVYCVTVTDANGCTKTTCTTITEPTEIVLSATQVNVSCNGGSTGSIDLMVSGGTPGYTYNWGAGQPTTQDRSGLTAGVYNVTVTDANGCTKTTSVTISAPTAIVLSTTQVNSTCFGGSDGSIDLTVSGGTPGYTYNWGAGQPTTEDRSGLTAGTYAVTVTDANGCTNSTSVTISAPTVIVLSTTQINATCNGGTNGSIDLTVSGGTSGYSYNWGAGQPTTQDRTGLSVGTYCVTVTDANGCTKTTCATITEPTLIVLSTTQVNAICNGVPNGSIDLTVTGGTPGYTYNWGAGQPTTQDRTGLSVGTYCVTVTDANGCTKTTCATITESAAIVLSTNQVNVSCNGGSNGSIDLIVSGGTPGYTYNWGAGQPTTQDRTGLIAGTYCVTVTDANGCTKTACATISEPTAIVLSTTQVNVSCFSGSNGSIDLNVSGGTSGYTYNWGAGQPTTQDRSGLSAGIYCVTVTDANGCTKTTCATITEPTIIVLSTTQVNVSCNGGSNGSIDLTVSGGTSGYTYNWGAGQPTTQDRSGLSVGTYCVTVTDANGCTKTTCVTITEPTGIVLSTTQVNVSCIGGSNGSIDLTVAGGTPGYTYNWGAGQPTTQDRSGLSVGTYCVTVTDANGCTKTICATITQPTALSLSTTQTNVLCNGTATGSIDLTVNGGTPGYTYDWSNDGPETPDNDPQDLSSLLAGTYTVTVTDANGCAATTAITITEPTALSLSSTVINPTNCGVANGSIDLTVTGGTPGYTYDWSNDGPETPDNDAQDLTNLLLGAYTVTVTDNNGCTATHSKTLIYVDVIAPSITCPGPQTVNADAGCAGTIGVYSPATLSDNCTATSSIIVTQSPAANTVLMGHNSVVTVTLTAKDEANNMSMCTFTVTLKDVTAPTVVCKGAVVSLNAAGSGSITTAAVFQSGADNCGTVNLISVAPSTFNCGNLGLNTVTLTVNDGLGNTASCSALVKVVDAIAPTMFCKPATISLNAQGLATLTAAQINNGSFDNCSLVSLLVSSSTFSCAQIGANIVELSGIDQSNNKASCTTTVTVIDPIVPTALCKNATVNMGPNGAVTVLPAQINNGSNDNCALTLTLTPNTFTCANIGTNIVTLRATDTGGNSATCTATVTIKDISAPTALCKNATIFLNNAGQATLSFAQIDNGSNDNCGISTASLSQTQFTCSELAGSPWAVTVTLKDAFNNTSSCVAYVTVKDIIAPDAVCENTTVQLLQNGTVIVYPATLADNSTDNCSVWSYSPIAKLYTTANLGNNNLTITVKDWSKNAATCVSVVTVLPFSGNHNNEGNDQGNSTESTRTAEFNLQVYPNPTAGDATLEFELPNAADYHLLIYDISGRVVLSREAQGTEGLNRVPLLMGNLSPGVYLITLQSDQLKAIKRLIVQE